MCKDPDGNIWACGRDGLILKYDNKTWTADTIQIKFNYQYEYFLRSIEYFENKLYLIAATMNINTLEQKYYLITGMFNNFSIVDSFIVAQGKIKWGYTGLYSNLNSNLYSFGILGLWVLTMNEWKNILSVSGTLYSVSRADENYMLAVGDFNKIYFYNGNAWENINSIFPIGNPTFIYSCVWTNGIETFIVGDGVINNSSQLVIWHGK